MTINSKTVTRIRKLIIYCKKIKIKENDQLNNQLQKSLSLNSQTYS